jgi:hypothetical protein
MKALPHADRLDSRRVRAPTLGALACVLLAATGYGVAQTATPVGVTKPAEYECSGLEGVALSNCKALNAAAVDGAATLRSASPSNATHDCSDMTGSALAICLDLNGQKVSPAVTDNGSAMQSPPGGEQSGAASGANAAGTQTGTDANSIAPRGGMNSGNAGTATTLPAGTTPPSGRIPVNPMVPGARMN